MKISASWSCQDTQPLKSVAFPVPIAYQHPVGRAVELMVSEAIVKAAPYLTFLGKTMVECLDDAEAYTRIHDGIFFKVHILGL